ncbi:MAG: 3-phenylpropionate/trans-cinnamate dioxygenase ferredoxin reductase component [Streptomyces sp.]|jgi:3-phenylpropionate/trans-cinnamate dioxygenase ferredoxin reductase subunit|nr:3-phenylpropionate/trans-cinnamate dioxygenase ferredoxin reductase component [Streptomyces sp.]
MAAPSVVVIGAGQGGADTAAALRGRGFTGRITLVGDESALPYQRPPLSKGYLKGTTDDEELELRPGSFFTDRDIELVRGDRAVLIDREDQAVSLASGRTLRYDELVLATGSRPRTVPVPGAGLPGVLTLRGIEDAVRLRQPLTGGACLHVVVVGAGFVGLEVAATARELGHTVTVVEATHRAMGRVVTAGTSARVVREHRARGTRVLLQRELVALHEDASGHVREAELNGGERVPADLVVVGVGVLPNTDLAADSGLLVGDGIIVDGRLRTSDPAISAIGDCARFPSPHAGRHIRLESVQNASDQARCVAAAICGEDVAYTAVPWFWSEQYALRLQIAGLTGGHDTTVTIGEPDGDRFSVLCFRDGLLTGAESVNRPADHAIVRRLLAAGTELTPREAGRPGFDLKAFILQPVPTAP